MSTGSEEAGAGPVEIVLKLATSLDGAIALANGDSQWITGEESRRAVHRMRAETQLILTGAGTVRADDPRLTARDVDAFNGPQPDCAILSSSGDLASDARLLEERRRVMLFSAESPASVPEGVQSITVEGDVNARPRFEQVIESLRERGYTRILIEAGARVATSALASGLVTRIEWFRAPIVLGGDAKPVFADLRLERLDAAPRFIRIDVRPCGADTHETYRRETA
ncbi:hypothetical protein GCM10011367_09270 [Marinicauda pacifica]|uniref:RibD family protein n=1 Tax=Marinicauda pacifica TaxID=1133559 RepID=A0A4S2HET1_9PROT|nr:RibD family protein [Marinicauda pacifica]TGY94577.1 RibD family protein [Marinicauda pacifica]GGE37020.1 hypothetical protein GCM10011367_09270 [Marinicauda pacifica]